MSGLSRAARLGLSIGDVSPETKRLGLHALAFTVVTGGGAATGYLVAGTWKGALTGSLVHLGFYGLAGALLGGGRLTTTERMVYGAIGLGGALGTGYLWMQRRS